MWLHFNIEWSSLNFSGVARMDVSFDLLTCSGNSIGLVLLGLRFTFLLTTENCMCKLSILWVQLGLKWYFLSTVCAHLDSLCRGLKWICGWWQHECLCCFWRGSISKGCSGPQYVRGVFILMITLSCLSWSWKKGNHRHEALSRVCQGPA
jgi:hypothetical protein